MVHTFQCLDANIVVDVNNGAVRVLDELTYHLLEQVQPPVREHYPAELCVRLPQYDPAILEEAWQELCGLTAEGLLFGEDSYIDRKKAASIQQQAPVKALCLHVSHDCNLWCEYCFASIGDFGTGYRITTDLETAKRTIDFVTIRSDHRRNVEVGFPGDELLMAIDTVKKTVEYARLIEREYDKCFHSAVTTSGVLLSDGSIEYIDREMPNAVLFIGGQKEINDGLQPTVNGKGNYDVIVPKFQRLIEGCGTEDHYLRGTFTRFHQDFVEGVKASTSIGRNISVEPAVGRGDDLHAFQETDLPALKAEYECLAEYLRDHPETSFFHFNVGLAQGPCAIKRLRGCGTGCEYMVVTPEGDTYPCHQFVGNRDYKLGSLYDGTFDKEPPGHFAGLDVYIRKECRGCWAWFYCPGGYNVSSLFVNDDIRKPHCVDCELEQKRLECVIAPRAIMAGMAKRRIQIVIIQIIISAINRQKMMNRTRYRQKQ